MVLSFSALVLLALSPTITNALPTSAATTSATSSWPLPHNITGVSQAGQTNLTTAGWGGIHVHDPSIILGPDGHYYSFSTHGLVVISRASKPHTLSGDWEILGSVLNKKAAIKNSGSTDPWAPDVHLVNGTYYCFYSVSQFGSQESAIGLATSTTGLGPGSWTDHGKVIASSVNATRLPLNITNAIDPNLFIDPRDDAAYLNYGSFWGDIWQLSLGKKLEHVKWKKGATQLSYDPTPPAAEEGAYMNYHEGYYYTWFSHGQCCGFNASALPTPGLEYSIRVGRSKSAQGPFVDKAGVELTSGGGTTVYGSHEYVYAPGGQGVLSDYEGRDVLYYHYINTNLDPSYADELKLLGWDYIDYVEGWPVLSY